VINQGNRERTLKRGHGRVFALDLTAAEGRFAHEPAHTLTAERLFERRWALTLLERVLERLGDEMRRDGKGPLFDRLGPVTLSHGQSVPYARVAQTLNMSEGAVKVAAHRLRARYRELIREEVGRTVDAPDQIDDEIRELLAALCP
jgi:DNA-directed RNA polymerase specialized sigma24 family protein